MSIHPTLIDRAAAAARAIRSTSRGLSSEYANASNIGFVSIDIAAVGDNLILPGAAGGRLAIREICIYNTVDQTVIFKDGPDTLLKLPGFLANTGWSRPYNDHPCFILSSGNGLYINLAAGGNLTGFLQYEIQG